MTIRQLETSPKVQINNGKWQIIFERKTLGLEKCRSNSKKIHSICSRGLPFFTVYGGKCIRSWTVESFAHIVPGYFPFEDLVRQKKILYSKHSCRNEAFVCLLLVLMKSLTKNGIICWKFMMVGLDFCINKIQKHRKEQKWTLEGCCSVFPFMLFF